MTLKEKNRQELLQLVELMNNFCGSDITKKGRKKEVANAKKAFCYYARNVKKHKLVEIGDVLNVGHDTVLYHATTGHSMVLYKDAEMIHYLNSAFGNQETGLLDPKDQEIQNLKDQIATQKRMQPFIEILKEVPQGKMWEVRERLELFLRSYKFNIA